jgi:hypothetical protein
MRKMRLGENLVGWGFMEGRWVEMVINGDGDVLLCATLGCLEGRPFL